MAMQSVLLHRVLVLANLCSTQKRQKKNPMASIHHYFARKQVGDTQKRGKPEMRSSCKIHSICTARLRPGPAAGVRVSPTSDTCQSVAILMNRRHCGPLPKRAHNEWTDISQLSHRNKIALVSFGVLLKENPKIFRTVTITLALVLQGSSQRSQGVAGRYALTVDDPLPLRLQKRRYAFDVFILLVFSSGREPIASGSQVHETR